MINLIYYVHQVLTPVFRYIIATSADNYLSMALHHMLTPVFKGLKKARYVRILEGTESF